MRHTMEIRLGLVLFSNIIQIFLPSAVKIVQ